MSSFLKRTPLSAICCSVVLLAINAKDASASKIANPLQESETQQTQLDKQDGDTQEKQQSKRTVVSQEQGARQKQTDKQISSATISETIANRQIYDVPSQTGLWLNSGLKVFIWGMIGEEGCCAFPSLYIGPSMRYQKKAFICSGSLGITWMPIIPMTPKGFSLSADVTAGYKIKQHGISGYVLYDATQIIEEKAWLHFISVGAEYSHLFGRSWLLQTRAGFAICPPSSDNPSKMLGAMLGIGVSYKLY